jgi:sulfide:quinone oxidoreductase
MSTSVLVLGAGFGGLELSTRLSEELGDQVDVTLIDRADAFVFGFSKLDVMFGVREPGEVRQRYADIATPHVRFRQETVTSIDPDARRVTTDLDSYDADVLVLALGADYDVAATPGLAGAGNEFYSVAGAEVLRDVLPSFRCPPAPSEAALLLDTFLRERGVRDDVAIELVMPFGTPIPPSPETSAAIIETFAERGIDFVPDRTVTSLDPATHEAVLDDGSRRAYDLFLGIPVHRAPAVVEPMTDDGWIAVDQHTLATHFPGVYAVGDVTSVGTPKAGVFAERAARALADRLIAEVRGDTMPAGFDGTGACWIEFGGHDVGRVDVDFFSTPGRPTGTFTPPSPATAAEKAAFGADRRARWFGDSN